MRILTRDTIARVGAVVTLAGWVAVRRDHGRVIFIDLRDRTGIIQAVFTSADPVLYEAAERLRPEWVVELTGTIKERPESMRNPDIPTGSVELEATGLTVLREAKTPPIAVHTDGYEIGEEVRMAYRYLDLRRERLQKNMRVRHAIMRYCREFLSAEEFTEIETPVLSKSTPEGARDYLVPSRLYPGNFYALPQSPQQYKQLLMVSGFEKYFQIARCFRDEDTRGDRQPEFTQLDIEMSFTTADEVLTLIERMLAGMAQTLFPESRVTEEPFPRLTYAEAMEKYKSDKPDLRKDKNDPRELAFGFVVDFPMFEWKEQEKRWDATHHPFTMPQVADAEDFAAQCKENPGKLLAFQYDVFLNGYEIGGGSIRIHDEELLGAVFEAMGNERADIEEKFGHMLEAFSLGVPPHGGIALGMDRLIMLLLGEPNIREIIAFPKTGDGRDLMMKAPAEVGKEQLKELHIKVDKKA